MIAIIEFLQIITLYMGITVNLIEAWEPYRAARIALNNTLEHGNVQMQTRKHIDKLGPLNRVVSLHCTCNIMSNPRTIYDIVMRLIVE